MNLDRVFADVEFSGDVSVAQTTVEHDDELFLTLGQFGLANHHSFFVATFRGKQTLNGCRNFSSRAGFFEVQIGTRFDAGFFGFASRHGGDHDQRDVAVHAFDFAHRARAFDARQQQVEHKQLGVTIFDDGCLQLTEFF